MMGDKTHGKVDELTGKAKEGAARVTGDEQLREEGKRDQAKGHAREAVGKVKDAAKDLTGD